MEARITLTLCSPASEVWVCATTSGCCFRVEQKGRQAAHVFMKQHTKGRLPSLSVDRAEGHQKMLGCSRGPYEVRGD